MVRASCNKLLTNLACLSSTEEYWPSVVFAQTSQPSVRTTTTSGQYSTVRSSRSVSKKLLRLPWLKKMLFAKLYFFTHFCKQPALESFYYLSYILRQKVKETRQFLFDIVVSRITWKSKYKIADLYLSYFSFLHCLK